MPIKRPTKAVTFILTAFSRSGGVQVITNVANHLAQNGFKVSILTQYQPEEIFYPLDQSVLLVPLVDLKRNKLLDRFIFIIKSFAYLKKNPAIIIATNYQACLPAFCYQKLTATAGRSIYLVQGYDPDIVLFSGNQEVTLQKIIAKEISRLTYCISFNRIVVSHWLKKKIGEKNAIVINNGIDRKTFFSPNRIPVFYRFGFNYRKSIIKGEKCYRDLYPKLQKIPGIKISILETNSFDLEGDHVSLKPTTVEEIADFYRSLDVFIYMSKSEGFALPPLEAMACGCLVLLCDCGGCNDYAINNVNCLIVKDEVEVIVQVISDVLANPIKYDLIRQAAVKTANKFSQDKMVVAYKNFINSNYFQ